MTIEQLLRLAVQQGAADLHIQPGAAPRLRIGGDLRPVEDLPLDERQVREMIRQLAPAEIGDDIDAALRHGCDFAYALSQGERFRVNLYGHLGAPSVVIRVVPPLRTFEQLHLPPVLGDIADARRGLTLVSGATGSGKSTTVAAIIDYLNSRCELKIVTIEDPVEFVHAPKSSLISHCELGRDTPSFEHGLRQALRQAPDVIFVGELRDRETVRMALRAADTGHQVFSTVHSANAPQTIDRVLALLPTDELALARQILASSLVAVVSQRLAFNQHGLRWPVVEVLRGDAVTGKYILENNLGELCKYMATGDNKMQTFDRHVLDLFKKGTLSVRQALRVASNPEAVQFEMRASGQPARVASA